MPAHTTPQGGLYTLQGIELLLAPFRDPPTLIRVQAQILLITCGQLRSTRHQHAMAAGCAADQLHSSHAHLTEAQLQMQRHHGLQLVLRMYS